MPDDNMFGDDAARDAALDYEDEAQLRGGRYYDEDDEEEEECVREGTYEGRGFPPKPLEGAWSIRLERFHKLHTTWRRLSFGSMGRQRSISSYVKSTH
eukprot:scaffold13021_cov73-Skeletonema_dohrnii-CCMP3373.AAC.1